MGKQYTADELKKIESGDLSRIILMQQEQISRMAGDYEKLMEQLRIASQARFGRRSEKLDVIDGQMSLFDEAEAAADAVAEEPSAEEAVSSYRRKKQKGKREADLIRNSIVTSSLGATVLNGKYVLALPLNRIEQ